MAKLIDCIREAEKKRVAIGPFNFANLTVLNAMFAVARELNVPVIAGVSEGERSYVGVREAVALIRSIREEFSYPIFLNADHTYSLEKVEEAAQAGFDAIIFDGAKLSPEENTKKTKEAVTIAKRINPDILVEGELGYIGMSSKLLDNLPEGVGPEHYTKPEDAGRFVKETGVDLFAPSVGNVHGMLKNVPNPRLDISRIKEIREKAGVPLVLHGGSGTSDEDFRAAIKTGISVVHISTEVRVAFKKALEGEFKEHPDEIAPYKFLAPSKEAVKEVIKNRLVLFNSSR